MITMPARPAVVAVLLTAAGPGLLFAPVFGVIALLLPLVLVVVVGFAVAEACRRWPVLVPWRAVLTLLVGLLALAEALLWPTTMSGLPTGDTVRALAAGVTESWQLTLQSTWPARPDPELLLFVPLAALAAAVFAMELLSRLRWPLVSLLPGLAVLGLSQAYVALTGLTATLAAVGFAVLAAVVLTPRMHLLLVPALVLGVAGALATTATDPLARPAYSLRDRQHAPLPPARVTSPLDEVAERLLDPNQPVFSYSTADPVDRWRLVVLDTFNGATWPEEGQYRRLGALLDAAPAVTATTARRDATVRVPDAAGLWVPSQAMPAAVTGVAPLVDEESGMLALPERAGPVSYGLSWWEPSVAPDDLSGAAIDPTARSGFGDLGAVPAGISELATEAVAGMRPSFQTALVLERYLSENYEVASGTELPTGNGWPQLRTFLLDSKLGTSEQFATAYVVLARSIGIPARVAVGFRASGPGTDVVVRNEDVLAWPEVAVAGIGWVPLDPSGTAAGSGAPADGLAQTTAAAREKLPPPDELQDPELPPDDKTEAATGPGDWSIPFVPIGIGLAAVLVAWLVGVPLAVAVRRWRRRRGRGARAVVGAWHEARDRLRAYGIPVPAGLTVRDLAGSVPDPPVVAGLHALARTVDTALWSPAGHTSSTVDEAWSAVRAIRRGLAGRPFAARVRAALNVRALLPLRRQQPAELVHRPRWANLR